MIQITPDLFISENEIQEAFIRASGPGGQNVNKVATAVQLFFDVAKSSLPEEVKARLRKLAGRRINSDGFLVIEARRHRTQAANREDALARLILLIRKAAEAPRPRIRTRPTRASKERRLKEKRKRSQLKKTRGEKPEVE